MSKSVSSTSKGNQFSFSLSLKSSSWFESTAASRISGLVQARQLIPILGEIIEFIDSNPRTAAKGPITKEIMETIEKVPAMFPFYSRGVLLGASRYERRAQGEWHFSFKKQSGDGLLDGGHTLLAVGMHILELIAEREGLKPFKVKDWPTFVEAWEKHQGSAEKAVNQLKFFIPIEVIVPNSNSKEALKNFRNEIFDICSARNSSKQLSVYTQANQRGIYDGIRECIDPIVSENVVWRENAGGVIPAHSVVSLAWIPINLLLAEGALSPKSGNLPLPKPIHKAVLYSGKGMFLKRTNQLTDSLLGNWREEEGGDVNVRRPLTNAHVHNAFGILRDLLRLHDLIYLAFPAAYNKGGKRFGTVRDVERSGYGAEISEKRAQGWATPFYRIPSCDFKDPFDVLDKHLKGKEYPLPKGRFRYPEAYIIPLTYGLQRLMEIDDHKQVVWKVKNPVLFLKKNFDEIVNGYSEGAFIGDQNPNDFGKDLSNYARALALFDLAFLKNK